jgi:GntR family transcriptional regulator
LTTLHVEGIVPDVLPLNPSSSVPLYAQLAERLLSAIRFGDWAVGEAIPSENTLAKEYKIGRPTVRQATETLIRRGYLERRRGSGTFVRSESSSVDLFSLGGTLASFSRKGIELSTRLLKGPTLVCETGGHPFGDRQAYFVERLASVECEPVLLERLWFDAEIFFDFDASDEGERSLSELVRRRYGLEATSADQRFLAVLPSPSDAEILRVSPGEPLLQVNRFLHFPTAKNAVLAQMVCKSDRFVFSQTIGGELTPKI